MSGCTITSNYHFLRKKILSINCIFFSDLGALCSATVVLNMWSPLGNEVNLKFVSMHPLVCLEEHYVWFSQFWSHFHETMHCLPQRLKSTFFEKILSEGFPKGTRRQKQISKNIDFSLWGRQCIVPWKWDQNCENHT